MPLCLFILIKTENNGLGSRKIMDFSNKTRDDINEIIRQANVALDEYEQRSKTKVYAVFIPFEGWRYFYQKQNAIADINAWVAASDLEDGEYKIGVKYLNDAQLEYCQDNKP